MNDKPQRQVELVDGFRARGGRIYLGRRKPVKPKPVKVSDRWQKVLDILTLVKED